MPTHNPPQNPPASSSRYIWQHNTWPQLTFDAAALTGTLNQARLLGLLEVNHFSLDSCSRTSHKR